MWVQFLILYSSILQVIMYDNTAKMAQILPIPRLMPFANRQISPSRSEVYFSSPEILA